MSVRLARIAVIGGGVVAAALLTASVSQAATTYTVKAGNAKAGTVVAISGTTTGKGNQVTFVDATTKQTLTCKSSVAPGSTKVGSGKAPAGIGLITGTKTKFNTCAGPLGLKFVVTGLGTWKINAASYAPAKGITTGSISAVSATVVDKGVCSFKVTGSVAITYTNKTKVLAVPGKTAALKVSNVTGCFGLIKNGDKASFKANYALKAAKAAFNPILIKRP